MLVWSDDHQYLFAIDDYNDVRNGRAQWVVYNRDMVPIFDRHSYEATQPPLPELPSTGLPNLPPPAPRTGSPIRMTDSDEGLVNRGYSYYSQSWVAPSGRVYAFVGASDGVPRMFVLHPDNSVSRAPHVIPYRGECEGWYFDREGWIYIIDGQRLRRFHPFTGGDAVVFDVSEVCPGCDIWQPHSSDDGSVHSATVRRIVPEGRYPYVGTVVFRRGQLRWFPAEGDLDESILTGNGRYLIIQESNNNRIINVETEEVTRISDAEGALAHIDTGPDFAVGEADRPDPGKCAAMYPPNPDLIPLFLTTNMGHVSVKGGNMLVADGRSVSLIGPNGLEHLFDHGMRVEDPNRPYDYQVFANLDYTGRVVSYLSNAAGHLDLYLYRL